MERLRNIFLTLSFQADRETQNLWQQYQLALNPKVYGFIGLMGIVDLLLTRSTGNQILPAYVLLTILTLVTSASGFIFKDWFFLLSKLTALSIIPFSVYMYAQQPGGGVASTLIVFPIVLLFLSTIEHVATVILFFLINLLLIGHSATQVEQLDQETLVLLTALFITTFHFFAIIMVLRYVVANLFKSRGGILASIEDTLASKHNLLQVFFTNIANELDSLSSKLKEKAFNWNNIIISSKKLQGELDEARTHTLDSANQPSSEITNSAEETEKIRYYGWLSMIYCGLILLCILIVVYVALGADLALYQIMTIVISLIVLSAGIVIARKPALRITGLYLFIIPLVIDCFMMLSSENQPYALLYFPLLILASAIIAKFRDLVIISFVMIVLLSYWYIQFPTLEQPQSVYRTNLTIVMAFSLMFSVSSFFWLERILKKLGSYESELREQTVVLNRLMATLFHDIANPLSVIQGKAELQAEDADNSEEERLLVGRMAERIHNLVEVTRQLEELESNHKDLPLQNVSLDEVLASQAEIFAQRLSRKELKLSIESSGLSVKAHEVILGLSIFSNLITNSIKFSPRGGEIRISSRRTNGDVSITISDQGDGISEDLVAQLKQNKSITSTAGTEGETGYGQGLRLVRHYLEKMGGNLRLEPGQPIMISLSSA